jgi:hypothetical protein
MFCLGLIQVTPTRPGKAIRHAVKSEMSKFHALHDLVADGSAGGTVGRVLADPLGVGGDHDASVRDVDQAVGHALTVAAVVICVERCPGLGTRAAECSIYRDRTGRLGGLVGRSLREQQKPRTLRSLAWSLTTEQKSGNPVELRGFEPLTFCMPCRRATSCAIAPQPTHETPG